MIISITTQQLKWQWVVGWVVNYDRRIGIEVVSWGVKAWVVVVVVVVIYDKIVS